MNEMGTRSDTSDSIENDDDDDETFNISHLFYSNDTKDDTNIVDNAKPQNSYENNERLPSPTDDDLEKYKNLAYTYYSKCEQFEKKTKDLEQTVKELKDNFEWMKRQKENAIKEKENMVIKFAVGEKKVLNEIQQREKSEKKCAELNKEKEILKHKVQTMVVEKARICQMFDNKLHEHKSLQQEYERLKSEITSLENELKWCQNNLKNEIETHKESQKTIESLNKKISESTEQIEQAKKDAQESVRTFKYSEENRAYVLDQRCKEQQASLILIKHERDDRENQVKNLQNTLDRLQTKQREMLQENNELSQKVQQLERERLESRQKLSELRGCADQQLQDAADLQMKTAQLEQYKLQLTNEQEQLRACKDQMNILKSRNSDLENDMESCRKREAELLLFTQQLTDKNVRLQSEFTALETKVHQLTSEQALIKRSTKEHETKAAMLLRQLSEQNQKYTDDTKARETNLNELVKQNAQLKQELFDQKGENAIIKRKYELSLKEVQKELQHCRKNMEHSNRSNSSSSSSLSGGATEKDENVVKVIQPDAEIDRQTLIEHVVKLQRISARKSEKIDFLEEHINTLIAELQKKSKLLQIYMLREQTGTLTSDKMDSSKADLAKLNGIMASMYSSRIADENLTLELSLDINRKLQAVSEDALLKNITLKKNVDTLGAEIDRLNKLLKMKS